MPQKNEVAYLRSFCLGLQISNSVWLSVGWAYGIRISGLFGLSLCGLSSNLFGISWSRISSVLLRLSLLSFHRICSSSLGLGSRPFCPDCLRLASVGSAGSILLWSLIDSVCFFPFGFSSVPLSFSAWLVSVSDIIFLDPNLLPLL